MISQGVTSVVSTSPVSFKPLDDSTSGSFGGVFHQVLDGLKQVEEDSSAKVRGLLTGDGTDIHTAMIATQKASLAFDMALAVRNKAVGAYQQLMSMQF